MISSTSLGAFSSGSTGATSGTRAPAPSQAPTRNGPASALQPVRQAAGTGASDPAPAGNLRRGSLLDISA